MKEVTGYKSDINAVLSKVKKYIAIGNDFRNSFEDSGIKKMYNDFNKAVIERRKIYIEYYAV